MAAVDRGLVILANRCTDDGCDGAVPPPPAVGIFQLGLGATSLATLAKAAAFVCGAAFASAAALTLDGPKRPTSTIAKMALKSRRTFTAKSIPATNGGACQAKEQVTYGWRRGWPSRTSFCYGRHPMTTKLEKELKREIDVDGKHYTVTLSPVGLKIAEKGHRKGHELTWKQVLTGESAHEAAAPAEGSSEPTPA